jgi:hypothetical protein
MDALAPPKTRCGPHTRRQLGKKRLFLINFWHYPFCYIFTKLLPQ